MIYPNLYVILVSDSGVGNKSTAIEIGTDRFLEKAVPDIAIMRGALTIKYLMEFMSQVAAKSPDGKTAEVTIYCDEFKVLAKGLYSDSGVVENLTKLYGGGKWEYGVGAGLKVVEKPCINLIAASTPEWLTTGSAADFIGGGFSSRIIPVAITVDEKQIANPKKVPFSDVLEGRLLHDLNRISQLKGEFTLTNKAEDVFEKWYVIRDQLKNMDQRLKGYYAKKHMLVHKIAMVLSASQGDDMVVTDGHIEAALALLGKVELTMTFAYQGVAWGDKVKYQDKVWHKIAEAGIIQHSKLLEAFRYCLTGSDLKIVIHSLVDEEKIAYDRLVTTGRPKAVYVTEGFIKEQCKKEGKAATMGKFPLCYQSHPEWFEEEKDGRDS